MNMSMKPAFAVEIDPNFDPSKMPTTGEDYLRFVIHERQYCPEVVTVPIDQKKIKSQVPAIILTEKPKLPCPQDLIPTIQWQQYHVDHFNKLRDKMECIARVGADNGNPIPFPSLKVERLIQRARNFILDSVTLFSTVQPTLQNVWYIDQITWIKLFDKQIEIFLSLAENKDSFSVSESGHNVTGFSWVCMWLYAGLLCLKIPIEPAMHHTLRQVVKACALVRFSQGEDTTFMDSIHLTIPISIITNFCNQNDLLD